jgi:hypothetical protein
MDLIVWSCMEKTHHSPLAVNNLYAFSFVKNWEELKYSAWIPYAH